MAATVLESFAASVRVHGGERALVYFGTDFTWRDIDDVSNRLAAVFLQMGMRRGERIAVQLQNCPEFIFATIAAWKVGAVIVPISPMYRVEETRKLLKDSGSRVLVVQSSTWLRNGTATLDTTAVENVLHTDIGAYATVVPPEFENETAVVPVGGGARTLTEAMAGAMATAMPFGDPVSTETAVLAYTSGTTGPPKGAIVSHSNLVFASAAYVGGFGVDSADEVLVAFAPLVHITGIVAHIGAWMHAGCTLVISFRFSAPLVLRLVEEYRATWLVGASTAYVALIAARTDHPGDTSSLRVLLSGGAPVPASLASAVEAAFAVPLLPGYGLTETSVVATGAIPGIPSPVEATSGALSVGRPVKGIEIRIVGDDGETTLDPGEVGEVAVRGPSVVLGYWERPEESRATFRDGWLHTGDIGYLSADGWLFLVGRAKDLIIASGYKVWPQEVEEVLYSHPAVREAAVVGVSDPYRGETVKAFVSLVNAAAADEAGIIAYCRERLAPYKIPRLVEFIDELPKNANGKIVRRELI